MWPLQRARRAGQWCGNATALQFEDEEQTCSSALRLQATPTQGSGSANLPAAGLDENIPNVTTLLNIPFSLIAISKGEPADLFFYLDNEMYLKFVYLFRWMIRGNTC